MKRKARVKEIKRKARKKTDEVPDSYVKSYGRIFAVITEDERIVCTYYIALKMRERFGSKPWQDKAIHDMKKLVRRKPSLRSRFVKKANKS